MNLSHSIIGSVLTTERVRYIYYKLQQKIFIKHTILITIIKFPDIGLSVRKNACLLLIFCNINWRLVIVNVKGETLCLNILTADGSDTPLAGPEVFIIHKDHFLKAGRLLVISATPRMRRGLPPSFTILDPTVLNKPTKLIKYTKVCVSL